MLRLFRNIRQKLILQENIRKYMWYALGEILLVMVGILLALQVNNWNEGRKALNLSDDTLLNLQTELVEAIELLKEANQVNEQILEESELYLSNQFDLDSLDISAGRIFWLTNSAPVTLELSVLRRELTSENQILGNEEIITKLRLIAKTYQNSESIRELSSEFWNNQVVPYYMKTSTMVAANRYFSGKEFEKSDALAILEDEEFRNLVALSNLGQQRLVLFYNQLILQMDETIQLIKESD
jgi:hypothetical protein